jgi:mRNA interferase MazF
LSPRTDASGVPEVGARRGEIRWASMREPVGSEPGRRRPVLVVSADEFNRSRIRTVLVAAVTGNLRLSEAPGNVLVEAVESGLPGDSVVNVSQLATLDKGYLGERVGSLGTRTMLAVDDGLRVALAL